MSAEAASSARRGRADRSVRALRRLTSRQSAPSAGSACRVRVKFGQRDSVMGQIISKRHAIDAHGGISSKIVRPGGMTAHGGRLRVKIAIVGRNKSGSSREPA